MYEYSNVSLIFEYILKLRIFVITIVIICILYTYFVYKLNERSVDKLSTNHFARASRSCSRTVRGKLISAFSTTTRRSCVSCVDRGRILTKDS